MVSLFEDIRTGKQGMFDPTKRYALTNKTGEPFEFQWNGVKVNMAVDETLELPQYLAYNATKKMIDQIMQAKSHKELLKAREINPAYISPNGAGLLGVPAARYEVEKMIVTELSPKVGNDAKLDIIRMKEMVEQDIKRSSVKAESISTVTASHEVFAELNEKPPVTVA